MKIEKELLFNKLEEINNLIDINYKEDPHIGPLIGLSGSSLFKFYYSKFLNNKKENDKGEEIIIEALDRINKGYNNPNFSSGIAGLCWTLDHLYSNKFIDLDLDILLKDIDQYLINMLEKKISAKNFDFLHGAIGIVLYLINRFKNTKSEELKSKLFNSIEYFLINLQKTSINIENTNKWYSIIDISSNITGVGFGLAHGMASILGILLKIYSLKEFQESSITILNGTINYLMEHKRFDSKSFFPSYIDTNGNPLKPSRVAWCYGDLGIALKLYQSSKILNNKYIEDEAIKILTHTSKRTDPKDTRVVDAGICHGSFGNSILFGKIYHYTKIDEFKNARDFWLIDGISKGNMKDGYAGYKKKVGSNNWEKELNVLQGIAGIGLSILDYLNTEKNNWDESLMIS
ncbi:lanthionine synthetase C family protein [uncultured Tenacibaculum sp.]|uniref:lanthionine synthetase C family protein n=1 Tax=uncultured Tenacibaculum sp. TaxID=174713 RepID=UPI00262C65DD|nr:lanthionine synthetase C family protein [uncultured Tenacibaculum sp.]